MSGERWPVYKGESFNLWDPDTNIYYASAVSEQIAKDLDEKRKSQCKTRSSAFAELDRETITNPATLPCYQPRIAFRNVTNHTNKRTVIAALVPGEVVIVHHAPYLLQTEGTARDGAYLLGILSSMILDWYARRVVELNLTFHLLNNFPIPRKNPSASSNPMDPGADPVAVRVADISGRLAAVDDRFADWAAEVGVPVASVKTEAEKQDLIEELDACVAHLYDLDEADLAVVYETFHAKTDYSERHAAVLEHFRRWAPIKQEYDQSLETESAPQ